MAKVNGVLGPIDTEELGFTLMHEHIMVLNWAMRQAFADWYDREKHVEQTVAELKARGVEFVDEVTDRGYGLVTHFKVPGGFVTQLYQPRYEKKGAVTV